jgi:membrane protein implicated in regulation of membrane protease activity
VPEPASPFRTGGAGWWLVIAVAIGAAAALVGTALDLETLWVAIAAGALAAVLPAYLDGRRRRPAPRRPAPAVQRPRSARSSARS